MNKTLENIIKRHIDDPLMINQIIVTVFVTINNIHSIKNKLIKELVIANSNPLYLELIGIVDSFDFDDLIEAFEIAIPTEESQTNGAVYTPKRIKEYIINKAIDDRTKPVENLLAGDVSCGCGAFLFSLTTHIRSKTKKTFSNIYERQIFGLDISDNSITRAKILLTLLAIYKGEDKTKFNFNLFTGNALSFDWMSIQKVKSNNGFDIIVGNPPYVRAKNIDSKSKELLKNWQVTKTGNPDLYIPFFEIGMEFLTDRGILGYITVNSFFKSVNARSLRNYISDNQFSLSIINFGHEQVFENKLTYTCLCFLTKYKCSYLKYTKISSFKLDSVKKQDFDKINYDNLDNHRGWLMSNPQSLSNIKRIENIGTPLGELLPIKNGIATLSNSIYIFRPLRETSNLYYFEKNGIEYAVEKGICRDIIKPNILKYEHQILEVQEKIIYPYTNGINPLSLIEEDTLKVGFKKAYKYLETNKNELAKRDKGKADYSAWYAFGRTQALTDKGLKLLFPYMAKHPHFVYTDNKEMLIYCGYAIFSDSENQLLVLKKILESSLFDYYMHNTSKPYASGYFSYAKNYVKHFGVCDLNRSERIELLGLTDKNLIDEFVIDKYQVNV